MDHATLEVEWVTVDRLQPNPANPRINDQAVPHVASSIQRFGWRQPIVAKPSGEVIAGNTRLKAALSLNMETVPVVWFEGSDLEATAYGIADNRTHEFAEWDETALASLLEELRAEDALDGVGYSTDDIDELLAELTEAYRYSKAAFRTNSMISNPRPRTKGGTKSSFFPGSVAKKVSPSGPFFVSFPLKHRDSPPRYSESSKSS